jgi:myo-inositol-1(or 4)-monophosphatase
MHLRCGWRVSPLAGGDQSRGRAGQLNALEVAVREAGAVALGKFRSPLKTWIKAGSSPVSEADLAVDALLRHRLIGSSTDFGWLSEESDDCDARLDAESVWVVDPIDGTRSYLAGRSDWVISVALLKRGRPELAAIFAPTTDELFLAVLGRGATRNGVSIVANQNHALGGARVAGPKRLLELLDDIHPPIVPQPRLGSLALRLTRVAHGELDIAFAGDGSHDWDLAAADLLVHEAGGVLTTLAGESLTYNQPKPVHTALVASGRSCHGTLITLVSNGSDGDI